MGTKHQTLRFDDLKPYLLHKNGNYLYKVPFRGEWAVLKVYYGSRSNWESFTKSVNNALRGQTSYWPGSRRRVELDCLALWSRHGFRVFDWYDDVEVVAPGCPPDGYLLCRYQESRVLDEYLMDESIPIDTRFETYRRFLVEWCRRHDVASAEREPRLVHENGDFGHVMLVGDEFLWFDFEMVYRSRSRVEEHVGHEIIQYLWYLLRMAPTSVRDRLLPETVAHYPNRPRLEAASDAFLRPPNPVIRIGRKLDERTRRGRKPTSKYNVSRALRAELAQQG